MWRNEKTPMFLFKYYKMHHHPLWLFDWYVLSLFLFFGDFWDDFYDILKYISIKKKKPNNEWMKYQTRYNTQTMKWNETTNIFSVGKLNCQ